MKLIAGFSLALLCAWGLATAPASTQEDLPDEIATPYLAHNEALEANDIEAAARYALAAWQAGERLEYDPQVVAILAGNYAQTARALGDHAEARRAHERTAELKAAYGAAIPDIADSLVFAANSALAAGENRDAISLADRAGDLTERAEGADPARLARLNFASRAIQAHGLWLEGRVRSASQRAEEALTIADRNALSAASYYGLMTFIRGAVHALDQEFADAAFRLTQAYAYLPGQRRTLSYWVGHVRDSLSGWERENLLERIAAAELPDYAEPGEDPFATRPDYGDGWVDATPQSRRPPNYPQVALTAGFDGLALVRFSVDENGRVVDPELIVSIPAREFGEAALDAVERWRYEPATLNGEPVRRDGVMTQFEFEMAN